MASTGMAQDTAPVRQDVLERPLDIRPYVIEEDYAEFRQFAADSKQMLYDSS